MEFDKKLSLRAKDETCRVPLDFDARLGEVLAALPDRPQKRARPLRAALIAAAVCGVLFTTVAAAYLMGSFDFLKGQDNYAALGQNEIYEQYAYPVGQSVTTEEGDVFTVERVAMDDKVCTVFYSIRFKAPVVSAEELKEMQRDSAFHLALIEGWHWSSWFTLYADGEAVSGEGYQGSFETQEYLADANTLYGAWRCLLSRPLTKGEGVEMEVQTYQNLWPSGASEIKESLLISFAAKPIPSEHIPLGIAVERQLQDRKSAVEVIALDHSPLGTFLTLREKTLSNYRSLEFALRDADTGTYIPYLEIMVSHVGDPEGYRDNIFELMGDVSGLKNLELIPVRGLGGPSTRKTVHLEDLPATDSGNPAGGYAPATYDAGEGKLIVTMKPLGAVTGDYARTGNGVYFLDADGNRLFERMSVQKFKNRADGTITVVQTPSAGSFQRDVDKVAQIWFFVNQYELLEAQTVKIPLNR